MSSMSERSQTLKRIGVGSFLLMILSIAVVFSYNNCAKSPLVYDEVQLASINSMCAKNLFLTFQTGFHPYLRKYCGSCHVQGGSGNGAFAEADAASSFSVFLGKVNGLGLAGIQTKLSGGHSGVYANNANAASEFATLKQEFEPEMLAYQTCQGQATTSSSVETASQKTGADAAGKTLVFPLQNILQGGESFDARVSLKVAVLKDSQSNILGYQFSNAAMTYGQPKAGAPAPNLYLEGFRLKLNGTLIPVTTYVSLGVILQPGETRSPLTYGSNSSFLSKTDADVNDQLALVLSGLGYTAQRDTVVVKPTPNAPVPRTNFEKIKHSDLIGMTAPNNVLRTRCMNCHNVGSSTGDFFTYTNALKYVKKPATGTPDTRMESSIYSKCYSGAMPKGGAALTEAELNKIGDWILNGAPQ